MAASLHTAPISAPEHPSVIPTSEAMETSSASGFPLRCISKILDRASLSGSGISISRSILPGLRIAGSTISILLVAAITTTSRSSSRPSSSVKICETTRSVAKLSVLLPRTGTIESISSKKMIAGDACLALRNISRIAFSDSPTYLLSSSGPLMLMKFAELSVATAFASKVFPVPGGP
uniref:Uncharacterized protein n=1 Tax=Candidatus Methanogaster sp. ANME-2c ERB4 TaxID=2759911 RepID=A0A7G9Y9D5_9EURY|nr:hypothetical protein JBICLBBK_00023 [Methanosarcinales archaeon ANME-2c ERB4]